MAREWGNCITPKVRPDPHSEQACQALLLNKTNSWPFYRVLKAFADSQGMRIQWFRDHYCLEGSDPG